MALSAVESNPPNTTAKSPSPWPRGCAWVVGVKSDIDTPIPPNPRNPTASVVAGIRVLETPAAQVNTPTSRSPPDHRPALRLRESGKTGPGGGLVGHRAARSMAVAFRERQSKCRAGCIRSDSVSGKMPPAQKGLDPFASRQGAVRPCCRMDFEGFRVMAEVDASPNAARPWSRSSTRT